MKSDPDIRAARLRGTLPSKELGARGLERVARNPKCMRLRVLIAVGVAPATAAADVYGFPAKEGLSPFAMGAGVKFEHVLLKNGAANLVRIFEKTGRLQAGEDKVAVIANLLRGSLSAAMRKHRIILREKLAMKLRRDPQAPNIIVKPRLPISFLGREHQIEPDALVASDDERFYTPVEIKSFASRGGKTDPADVRSACRQAAVAVVALRRAVMELGVADPETFVPASADLVFRMPGFFQGVPYRMSLGAEVDSLERVQKEGAETIAEVEDLLGAGVALDTPETLNRIPNHYIETCRDHCALWPVCKKQAVDRSDPVILGSRAAELFADAGSLKRILALLHGRGSPPRTADETALRDVLQEAYRAYRKAVGRGD